MIEKIGPVEAEDKQIGPAVVIVIAGGNTFGEGDPIAARGMRDILKNAVTFVEK
jgi:hypothetical protein